MNKTYLFLICSLFLLSGCAVPPDDLINVATERNQECVQTKECTEFKLEDSYKFSKLSEANRLNGIEEIWCVAFSYSFYNYYGAETKSWYDAGEVHVYGKVQGKWVWMEMPTFITPNEPGPIDCDVYRDIFR